MTWRILLGITLCAAGTTAGILAAGSQSLFGFGELAGSGVPTFALFTLPVAMLAGIAAYGIRIQLLQIPDDSEDVDIRSLLSRAFKTRGVLSAIVGISVS